MSIRSSRVATGLLVAAILVLTAQQSWAIREKLPPSKDEWGLKYEVAVTETGDKVNVVFTLADEGRLKPIYSVDLVAFSAPTAVGGSTYDVNVPIKLKPAADGKRTGEVQFDKKHLDRAKIRILTFTTNGKRHSINGGLFYDIPVAKYLQQNTTTAASSAAPAGDK